MKHGPPAPAPVAAPTRTVPTEPRAARPDLIRSESSYNSQREQSDRDRRRAEPEFQDGSYGFEVKDDEMDVDLDHRRDMARDTGRNNRRGAGRGRDGGSGRDVGNGGRVDRGLYSDDLYPRPRGRGIR